MATPDMEVIKEIPGYKVILKAVLKSQIQQLVEHLATTTDEESVILTASVADGTLCHLGSDSGKVFLEDHEDIKSQFLGFCLKRHHKKKQEKEKQEAQEREEAMARMMQPITPPGYGGPRPGFMPQRSPRHHSPRSLHPVSMSRVPPGGRMRSPGVRHQPYPMARPQRVPLTFDQQGQLPGPRPGHKLDGQVIKIEPDDDDEKSNQSVNEPSNVQTPSSVPDSSEPSSPSVKPSTPSQSQGPSASDNDDAKSESSNSTIPNEASDLKLSDTVPPEGLSLDSDLSNLISAETDTSVNKSSVRHDSAHEAQASAGLDPNVSVKLEAVADSEMDLEITGVELGQIQSNVQESMSSQDWMTSVQNVMQGASGSSADIAGQGYNSSVSLNIWNPPGGDRTETLVYPNQIVQQSQVQQQQKQGRKNRYPCKYCGKLIRSNYDLVIHERSHTGEKPFKCGICEKRFANNSHLRVHSASHLNFKLNPSPAEF